MAFFLSFSAAVIFIAAASQALTKRPAIFYSVSALCAAVCTCLVWTGVVLPSWYVTYIMPVLIRGGLSGALFVIVMITGALPNGSYLMKKLMPVRAQLSIIACIFTLGHNIAYGRTYFVLLFTQSESLPLNQQLAAVCSVIMLAIMLPLFVTSFRCVRRRMQIRTWKKLQRTAYLFYALLYAHIMLLNVPGAVSGRTAHKMTAVLYTAVFACYLTARLLKRNALKNHTSAKLMKRQLLSCCAAALAVVFMSFIVLPGAVDSAAEAVTETADGCGLVYRNGTFTGKAFGNSDYITVCVSVMDDVITGIEIIDQHEDEPYWGWALDEIDIILAAGNTDVDTVSMATYSSAGILDAVRDALASAEVN